MLSHIAAFAGGALAANYMSRRASCCGTGLAGLPAFNAAPMPMQDPAAGLMAIDRLFEQNAHSHGDLRRQLQLLG